MLAKNLVIAVIPTEEDYNIHPGSSSKAILACKGLKLYGVSEYLQAQNDDELPLHWSFLFNSETKEQVEI